jgi:hypothetical protein
MANLIKLKRSANTGQNPTTANLELGELAINTYDGNLFFKKNVSGTETILSVATLTGTQSLSNKTLSSPVLTGTLTAGGGVGNNGQVLQSTGSGIQWVTNTLDGLSDVVISSPTAQQVLKFNGTQWINAANDTAVASAVFAPQATSDLGSVTDNIIGSTEDLGFVIDVASFIYDMGQLKLDGIASLSNIDQSVKADYIGYAIIFGF